MSVLLAAQQLQTYRAVTFRLRPADRLASREQAVAYVNERGFLYFWPISGILMPSLWSAVAGDRPVADQHDDPGHVTWGWKDSLLGSRAWYYAKVLRKKATMIALPMAAYFYALSENYGAPEEDYLTLYEQGRLTLEARTIYEVLLREGPLDTIALRRAARMASAESDGRFNKALTDLQADFKLTPVGVAKAGAWNYAFVYDLTHRVYPELPEQAHYIGELEARRQLAACYLRSVGALQARHLAKLFGWQPAEAARIAEHLIQSGAARACQLEGEAGEWLALENLWG